MIAVPATLALPLRIDQDGVICVGPSRVMMTTIVQSHRVGDAPEEIHDDFPTVPLADIYAVIAFYQANQAEVDAYMAQLQAEADAIRRAYEENNPRAADFRARMRAAKED